MVPEENAADLFTCIEAEQRRLREMLSRTGEALLVTRPANDKWSVVENVRHLLFAEQRHLGRFAPGGPQWSPLGLPPHVMRDQKQLSAVGRVPASSIDGVLDAWTAVHALSRRLVRDDTAQMRKALEGNLRHLRAHVKVIERLVRAAP